MPGAGGVLDVEAFEPGEIAGMRSAAWILVATAALGALAWVATRTSPPFTSAIDLFLGIQLLRLRHNWRAWAMLRAWIGLAIAAAICISSIAGSAGAATAAAGVVLGLGQGTYAGSLLLLLFGVPSMQRVTLGRIVFAVSILLTIVGIVLMMFAAAPEPV